MQYREEQLNPTIFPEKLEIVLLLFGIGNPVEHAVYGETNTKSFKVYKSIRRLNGNV